MDHDSKGSSGTGEEGPEDQVREMQTWPHAASLPASMPLVTVALPTFPGRREIASLPLNLCRSHNLHQWMYGVWCS